ncbi:hypothetical protein [Lacticaseibacillus hulanensis]|uniref:hypothetical protein n=1 Tax=Lacticaseibacillus hulanensis TaxID=2493111 RepID=UPI0013E2E17A|nr:hypothetical protein [Lacticaseibacillus hulanensis]
MAKTNNNDIDCMDLVEQNVPLFTLKADFTPICVPADASMPLAPPPIKKHLTASIGASPVTQHRHSELSVTEKLRKKIRRLPNG